MEWIAGSLAQIRIPQSREDRGTDQFAECFQQEFNATGQEAATASGELAEIGLLRRIYSDGTHSHWNQQDPAAHAANQGILQK